MPPRKEAAPGDRGEQLAAGALEAFKRELSLVTVEAAATAGGGGEEETGSVFGCLYNVVYIAEQTMSELGAEAALLAVSNTGMTVSEEVGQATSIIRALHLDVADVSSSSEGGWVRNCQDNRPLSLKHPLTFSKSDLERNLHIAFCRPLFSSNSELGLILNANSTPGTLMQYCYVFESASGAKRYIRRAWRFLTENDIFIGVRAEQESAIRNMLNFDDIGAQTLMMPRVTHGAPAFGDESYTHRSRGGIGGAAFSSPAFSKHTGGLTKQDVLDTMDSMHCVVFRVGNVVVKLWATHISQVRAYALARRAELKVQTWVRDYSAQCAVAIDGSGGGGGAMSQAARRLFSALLETHKKLAQRTLAEGLKAAVNRSHKDRSHRRLNPPLCAHCGTTSGADDTTLRRCAGCRGKHYCSGTCQKAHWVQGGHKKTCTLEFKLGD